MIISHLVFLFFVQLVCCYKLHDETTNFSFPCGTELESHRNYRLLDNDHCGAEGSSFLASRILGGTIAKEGEFPWMAMILSFDDGKYKFRCGGAIINEKYILTAPHCLDYTEIFVRVGEINSGNLSDCFDVNCHARNVAVERLIPHERYSKRTKYNDIALIRLKEKIKFDDYKRPICLPILCDVVNKNFKDTKLLIAGWGGRENYAEVSRVAGPLRKVEVLATSRDACSKQWKEIRRSQICTWGFTPGVEGVRGILFGDSGSPLIYRDYRFRRYYAIGVASFVGPADYSTPYEIWQEIYKRYPPVYSRVPAYVSWILDNIKQ